MKSTSPIEFAGLPVIEDPLVMVKYEVRRSWWERLKSRPFQRTKVIRAPGAYRVRHGNRDVVVAHPDVIAQLRELNNG